MGGMRRKGTLKLRRRVRVPNAAKSCSRAERRKLTMRGIRRKVGRVGSGRLDEYLKSRYPNILCLKTSRLTPNSGFCTITE